MVRDQVTAGIAWQRDRKRIVPYFVAHWRRVGDTGIGSAEVLFIEEHGAAEFLRTATPKLYAPASKEAHPEWIEEHLAAVHNFLAPALVNYYKAMIARPDRTDVLRNSQVPVLFVLGRYDTAVPLEDGLKQCYLPQLSYIHLLENTGHMGMIEEQQNTNEILSQFVNTIEITA